MSCGECASTLLDLIGEPLLHFLFEPSHSTDANLDSTRESPLRLQLVDHGSTQTCDFADLGQAKYVKYIPSKRHDTVHR